MNVRLKKKIFAVKKTGIYLPKPQKKLKKKEEKFFRLSLPPFFALNMLLF